MTRPSSETIAAWTALATANRMLLEDIEAALRDAGLPRLEWYDALLEIERAGPEGIRPFELKDRLLLPQYGMSRLLDRMDRAGLVVRGDVKGDGRGQIVRLTARGAEQRRAMWPVYAERLVRRIEDRLTPEEARGLAALLRRLAGG